MPCETQVGGGGVPRFRTPSQGSYRRGALVCLFSRLACSPALLALSGVLTWRFIQSDATPSEQSFFYDQSAKKLFAALPVLYVTVMTARLLQEKRLALGGDKHLYDAPCYRYAVRNDRVRTRACSGSGGGGGGSSSGGSSSGGGGSS